MGRWGRYGRRACEWLRCRCDVGLTGTTTWLGRRPWSARPSDEAPPWSCSPSCSRPSGAPRRCGPPPRPSTAPLLPGPQPWLSGTAYTWCPGASSNATARISTTPRVSSGRPGELVASYRKVHLFDVDVPGATNRESAVFSAGDRPVVANLGDDGPILGLSVCYDLRFPELYRIEALMGATIVSVPCRLHHRHRGRPLGAAGAGPGGRGPGGAGGGSPVGHRPQRDRVLRPRPRRRPLGPGAGRRWRRGRRIGGGPSSAPTRSKRFAPGCPAWPTDARRPTAGRRATIPLPTARSTSTSGRGAGRPAVQPARMAHGLAQVHLPVRPPR